jgi:hypothetical protein
MNSCGGCQGQGSHQRHCPRHPDYHPWRRLAEQAENIGDTIGGNDPGLANQAYALSARIKSLIEERPYHARITTAPAAS